MPITAPMTQDPGDWGLTWSDLPDPPTGLTGPQQTLLLKASIAAIWWLTGTRFGVHTTPPLRPCLRCGGCGCGGSCGGIFYDRIDLDSSGGERPVLGVTRVTVAGVDLDKATDYAIENNRWLLRTPTGMRWVSVQDVAAAVAPLEIVWRWGLIPSSDLLYNAVAPLVSQLWAAWKRQPCGLDPAVVKTVQREGINFTLTSPGDVWREGYTGVAPIDAACTRAWPLGPTVQAAPGFFDPAACGIDFSKVERAT